MMQDIEVRQMVERHLFNEKLLWVGKPAPFRFALNKLNILPFLHIGILGGVAFAFLIVLLLTLASRRSGGSIFSSSIAPIFIGFLFLLVVFRLFQDRQAAKK